MSEWNPSKQDVIDIAMAVEADHYDFNSGDYSADYYNCIHCAGISKDYAANHLEIKHNNECAVLKARDILTRI